MVVKVSPTEAVVAALTHELEVARTSLEFVRDTILISQGDGDLLDALIFTAALDANMAPVEQAPELGLIYGGVDASAPDDLRRPVTMHAIAQSLGLPAETVRRRFAGFVRTGACLATPRGVIVPREAVVSPGYKAIQGARYERASEFAQALRALKALPESELADAKAGAPLVRAANRALSEYTLRACQRLLGLIGDVVAALVLMQLVLENTQGMNGAALARWARDPAAVGRPVRIIALTQALPFSRETVRRHIGAVSDLGFCRRLSGGFVAVAPPAAIPALSALVGDNRRDLRRLFRLGVIGVLAEWDARG